ncbi:arabinan endo-1,5-alpha-L-arabinosidase [Spirosoma utsteinense]|uniref:Arabinan endo-1,5-alpha-L-arabinosidase n=1 Tax=Spirosoma utsteinense TaxID=2585773 RepID=A0ABR6W9P8_9BACT|nr:arabinan endo-1,5-alpha-L-arabinosidase [Spirosoma utsteinense]MBC3789032.1 arabinan endo-1,5-alpha-L-arabinosidase [Spirosoma utsteinense]MBC3792642.1 arabinan endo-1,5-alpha-L-arabinosidase [Spirosoma utsteinense]
MMRSYNILFGMIGLLLFSGIARAQTVPLIPVHDPVMIRQDSTYYVFATGKGIRVWSSTDRRYWKSEKPVFESAPTWTTQTNPATRPNDFWAPDISFHKGIYYLYYSSSVFGKNSSAIGLTTNKTLNPADPNYQWIDRGLVIQSIPGRDNWNAIDPNLIVDTTGHAWLTFGSFWGGIKLVRLGDDLTGPAIPSEWYTLASRPRTDTTENGEAANGAVEAPFLFRKNGFYYLFVSFDYCCRGPKSTYKLMVGRSASITGPYLDQNGKMMTQGGGTLVLAGDKDWYGVGHNSTYTYEGKDYLVYHGYDATDNGKSKLLIKPLRWDAQGWPKVE